MKRVIDWLFSRSGHIAEQAVRGGVWLTLSAAGVRMAGLVKVIILARLLAPDDFGLMGIAVLMLKWLEYFTETGLNAALIRKSDDIRPYLDTVWTVQILRGCGLMALLVLAAPWAASFFGTPEAAGVIRAAGVVMLLRAFTNPAVVYVRKELDFRRELIWRLSGAVVGVGVAVPIAIAYHNVWALVVSVIAAQLAEVVASYWIEPYSPRLRLDRQRTFELMRFGKWIFWVNVITFVSQYADSVIVGRLLGPTALGLYHVTQQFAILPTMQIQLLLRGVMFPAFSKVKNTDELPTLFLRSLGAGALVMVPAGAFLTAFSTPLVDIVLGPLWAAAAPVLRILAWCGVATALSGVTSAFFLAAGRPEVAVRALVVQSALVLAGIYPGIMWLGLSGVAVIVSAAAAVALVYQLALVSATLGTRRIEVVKAFRGGVFGATPFFAVWLVVPASSSASLYLVGALAGLAYVAIVIKTMRSVYQFSPSTFLVQTCE